jgi:hypothetical protein
MIAAATTTTFTAHTAAMRTADDEEASPAPTFDVSGWYMAQVQGNS